MAIARREFVVLNRLGLHARPAARFVHCALRYQSTIRVLTPAGSYDGKRIMELLIANLDQGAKFTVEAEGPDAEEACDSFEKLMKELEFEEA